MRILLLTREFPTPGQPTRGIFNAEMARGLAEDHDVRVVCPIGWTERDLRTPTTRQKSATVHGIPVDYPTYFYTPMVLRDRHGAFLWRSLQSTVNRVADEFRPDVVLSYWSHPDGEAGMRLARQLDVPGFVMVGGSDVLIHARNPSQRAAIARVLRCADGVLTVSDHLRSAVTALGVDRARISIVRRGVAVDRFAPGDRNEARQRLGLSEHGGIILFVGRLDKVKGLDVLAETCALLKGTIDFRLHVVGDGPLAEAARADFASRHLGDVVAFEGRIPHAELPDWFRAANVTVLPSWSEGLPNVLLESIACGTPFAATSVGGISEIADPALDAVVPPGDAAALADAVRRLCRREGAAQVRRFRPMSRSESARQVARVLRSRPAVAPGDMVWV